MKFQLFPILIVLLLLAAPSFAKPTAVTLYPHGATITEQATIASGSETIALQLPNVALPKSLKLALIKAPSQKIIGIEFESILPDSSVFKKLEERISQLEQNIAAIDDQLKSNNLTLAYWKNQQDLPIKTLDDARTMGKIIRDETISLLKDSTRLNQQKDELNQQLKEARKELQQKTGNNKRNWLVTVRLAHPASSTTELTYTYRVRHAGWASNYTLNALPDMKQVDWLWTAKIKQETGINWTGIELKVATTEPVFTLTPPYMHPWNINAEIFTDTPRSKMLTMAMTDERIMAAPAAAMENAEAMPRREEGQLFDIYDLGRVDIASGKESRITIREGHWNADFIYLSRPLASEQVFLEAKLDLPKDFIPLPTGAASIQVAGVHVGQRTFSLHENRDVKMSFGSDPGIVVDVKTDHVAGKQGLLAKKNTYTWNWAITFTNNKKIPIDLLVEDTLPHIGHEKIELMEQLSEPLPEKENGKLIWKLPLPAQGKQQIEYGYAVKYPADMDVSLGR